MKGPYVVLSPISKSHPFDERKAKVGTEDDPLKIGRAVARLKPNPDNAIFDCKVLSRNHAVLWCIGDEFYIRDTKSSNGTFVNNERLAVTGEESKPKQIYTGDIIQLGVEIVENANKVAHGCIYAMVQLFDSEGNVMESSGREMSAGTVIEKMGTLHTSQINNHQLFQLQQFIAEALYREEQRQKKVRELEEIIESTELAMEAARKAVVNEDRLLSRIEMLEAQLAAAGKNATPDKLKEDMQALIEDKAKFEALSKEELKRAQEQKAEAELKLADIDRSLVSTEEDNNRLKKRLDETEARLGDLAAQFDAKQSELNIARGGLQDAEKRILDLEEREQLSQRRIDDVIKARDLDRTMPSLIRHLMEAIRTEDYSSHEQSLAALADMLRERGVGQPESVPEPPMTAAENLVEEGEKQEGDICNGCVELEKKKTIAVEECERCLKENLQLKSTIRDLETRIAQVEDRTEMAEARKGSENLEIMAVRSISCTASAAEREKQSDRFLSSIILFSMTPWLALILLILHPVHSRLITKKVD